MRRFRDAFGGIKRAGGEAFSPEANLFPIDETQYGSAYFPTKFPYTRRTSENQKPYSDSIGWMPDQNLITR